LHRPPELGGLSDSFRSKKITFPCEIMSPLILAGILYITFFKSHHFFCRRRSSYCPCGHAYPDRQRSVVDSQILFLYHGLIIQPCGHAYNWIIHKSKKKAVFFHLNEYQPGYGQSSSILSGHEEIGPGAGPIFQGDDRCTHKITGLVLAAKSKKKLPGTCKLLE